MEEDLNLGGSTSGSFADNAGAVNDIVKTVGGIIVAVDKVDHGYHDGGAMPYIAPAPPRAAASGGGLGDVLGLVLSVPGLIGLAVLAFLFGRK